MGLGGVGHNFHVPSFQGGRVGMKRKGGERREERWRKEG